MFEDSQGISGGTYHEGKPLWRQVCINIQYFFLFKRFTNEAILWGQLSHANLLPFYGLYQFRSRACLVSPWVDNGHVNEYLDLNPDVDRTLLVSTLDQLLPICHGELPCLRS